MDAGRVRQIGAYRLLRKLGQGGMSNVFLGEDEAGVQVAIKLLNLSLQMEPEFRKRFQREAELTQRLDHPAIVKTLSWQDDPDSGVFLVMEHVPGGNLRRRLEDSDAPLELATVLEWLEPVCRGLDYAHAQGVVHRDLKPENLLFDTEGKLKIADFGVARVAEGSRLTRTGVLPGTPEYMAPEQFSEQGVGSAADLYSLATIVYEMLTGATPFHSENLARILQRQAFEKAEAPSLRRPDLPAYLDRVLLRALEKEPGLRFASAGEFHAALAHPPLVGAPVSRAEEGSGHELPTRQVSWSDRPEPADRRQPPWIWMWLLWTVGGLVWLWRLLPLPAEPSWLATGVGWQSVPLGRQLCCSVLWNGIEIALTGPNQKEKALDRGRFAATQWESWLQLPADAEERIRGEKDGSDYRLFGPGGEEWLTVDPQLAANLKARPQQAGEYWQALIEDVDGLTRGQLPRRVKELERKRPLRLDGSAPRYPLLERLYQRCRFQRREGGFSTAIIVEALESLGYQDSQNLREAARSVPLELP